MPFFPESNFTINSPVRKMKMIIDQNISDSQAIIVATENGFLRDTEFIKINTNTAYKLILNSQYRFEESLEKCCIVARKEINKFIDNYFEKEAINPFVKVQLDKIKNKASDNLNSLKVISETLVVKHPLHLLLPDLNVINPELQCVECRNAYYLREIKLGIDLDNINHYSNN